MTLTQFVQSYVSKNLQLQTDYIGPQGWLSLAQLALHDLESRGLFNLDRKKRKGVEVSYGYWIALPSDLRNIVSLRNPNDLSVNFGYQILSGKIKIDRRFGSDETPRQQLLSNWNISDNSVMALDVATGTAQSGRFDNQLLVCTDGDQGGLPFIIEKTVAQEDGTNCLYLEQAVTQSSSANGSIVNTYLILEYMAKFNALGSASDTIPVLDIYTEVLLEGILSRLFTQAREDRVEHQQRYEFLIATLLADQSDQGEEQMRARPTMMSAYDQGDLYAYKI